MLMIKISVQGKTIARLPLPKRDMTLQQFRNRINRLFVNAIVTGYMI